MEAPLVKEESSSKVSASFKSPRFAELPSPRKPATSPDSSLRGRSVSAEEKALEKLKPDADRSADRKLHHHRTHSGGQGSRLESKDGGGGDGKSRSGASGSGHKERRGLEHSDGADRGEKRTYYRQASHGHLSQHVEKGEHRRDKEKRTSAQDDAAAVAAAATSGLQQRSGQRNSSATTGERVEKRSTTPEHRAHESRDKTKENANPHPAVAVASGSDISKMVKEREREHREREHREKERDKEREKEKEKERERQHHHHQQQHSQSRPVPAVRIELPNPLVQQLRLSEKESPSSSLGSEGIAESTPSASEDDTNRHHSLSPREQRILSLEAVAQLRRDLEEALVELEKQRELELKVEEKWEQGTMGLKLKELKKKALDKTLDQTAILEEQKKLKAIRDITYQRMRETTRKLEQRIQQLKSDLSGLERNLHTQFKNLQPQMLQQNRARVERLIKRRPSIEDLIYRGIYVADPSMKRRSRDVAKEKLDELFSNRRRSSGSYSASWMFGSDDGSDSKFSHSSASTDMRRLSTVERKQQEFLELLNKEKCLVNYSELQDPVQISEGAFSWVFRASWRGMTVAVKKLKPRDNVLRIAQAEVLCLLLTKSNPHTINILGASLEPCCIVMPYYENGSLYEALHRKHTKFSHERVLHMAKCIAIGCQGLHGLRPPLMHRDLTTNNVLLDEKGDPLIIDFGISREEVAEGPTQLSPIGHPRLRAPEITNRQPYTKSIDVYNFGTLLYELVVGRLPFDDLPDQEASYCTSKGLLPPIPPEVPKSIRKLITACWSAPESRPSFKQIVFKLSKMEERLHERRQEQQQQQSSSSRRDEQLKNSKERPLT